MMKQNCSISFVNWQRVTLALAGLLLHGLLGVAYCQDNASQSFAEWQTPADSTVLLLQQTPPDGGEIIPVTGIHHLNLEAEVTLTAIPKPGYHFLYWIGDVIDPSKNNTVIYLDTPKIVIAVFERSEYEVVLKEGLQNSVGGYGGLSQSRGDYSNSDFWGGTKPRKFQWPELPEEKKPPSEETPEEVPVPEEGEEPNDEFPVPEVPEPATVLLLGLGGLLLVRQRSKR